MHSNGIARVFRAALVGLITAIGAFFLMIGGWCAFAARWVEGRGTP